MPATSRFELRTNGYVGPPTVHIAVVGTREAHAPTAALAVQRALDDIRTHFGETRGLEISIVTGGATGYDSLGIWYASATQIPCAIHWPLWDLWGKRAGFLRNTAIVNDSDIVLAWPRIGGRGTQHTVDAAYARGVPSIVWEVQ
jgi:hypothetical protein